MVTKADILAAVNFILANQYIDVIPEDLKQTIQKEPTPKSISDALNGLKHFYEGVKEKKAVAEKLDIESLKAIQMGFEGLDRSKISVNVAICLCKTLVEYDNLKKNKKEDILAVLKRELGKIQLEVAPPKDILVEQKEVEKQIEKPHEEENDHNLLLVTEQVEMLSQRYLENSILLKKTQDELTASLEREEELKKEIDHLNSDQQLVSDIEKLVKENIHLKERLAEIDEDKPSLDFGIKRQDVTREMQEQKALADKLSKANDELLAEVANLRAEREQWLANQENQSQNHVNQEGLKKRNQELESLRVQYETLISDMQENLKEYVDNPEQKVRLDLIKQILGFYNERMKEAVQLADQNVLAQERLMQIALYDPSDSDGHDLAKLRRDYFRNVGKPFVLTPEFIEIKQELDKNIEAVKDAKSQATLIEQRRKKLNKKLAEDIRSALKAFLKTNKNEKANMSRVYHEINDNIKKATTLRDGLIKFNAQLMSEAGQLVDELSSYTEVLSTFSKDSFNLVARRSSVVPASTTQPLSAEETSSSEDVTPPSSGTPGRRPSNASENDTVTELRRKIELLEAKVQELSKQTAGLSIVPDAPPLNSPEDKTPSDMQGDIPMAPPMAPPPPAAPPMAPPMASTAVPQAAPRNVPPGGPSDGEKKKAMREGPSMADVFASIKKGGFKLNKASTTSGDDSRAASVQPTKGADSFKDQLASALAGGAKLKSATANKPAEITTKQVQILDAMPKEFKPNDKFIYQNAKGEWTLTFVQKDKTREDYFIVEEKELNPISKILLKMPLEEKDKKSVIAMADRFIERLQQLKAFDIVTRYVAKDEDFSKFTYLLSKDENKQWKLQLKIPSKYSPEVKIIDIDISTLPKYKENQAEFTFNELLKPVSHKESRDIGPAELFKVNKLIKAYHEDLVKNKINALRLKLESITAALVAREPANYNSIVLQASAWFQLMNADRIQEAKEESEKDDDVDNEYNL